MGTLGTNVIGFYALKMKKIIILPGHNEKYKTDKQK